MVIPTSPMSAVTAVKQVAADRLLLPGIQRSFVWKPTQIETLFDSILRDYPIGSLLMWETRPQDHPHLTFLRLATDAKGKSSRLVGTKPPSSSKLLAILDGQQRLTALNIGLRGSLAPSEHGVIRRLYIELDTDDPTAGSEDKRYMFQFRTGSESKEGAWFLVSEACGLKSDRASLDRALERSQITPSAARRRVLSTLAKALNERPVIRFDIERGDLDRVLNIFARANKGGTPLTYVDLLVSTATARWKNLNARDEIADLRRSMNDSSPEGFDFSADRIVKAGLVLLDTPTPKFHVESFMQGGRARQLEVMWPDFRQAMEIAAGLLASFALSGRTLPAENVAIPIAYYALHRKLKPAYITANAHERDRMRVKAFVARTLLRRGYWTGAVDPVLTISRTVIKKFGANSFPLGELEKALASVKAIDVDEKFINELASLRHSDRRTPVLLRLLFPHMLNWPVPKSLDKDHIFPISKFTASTRPKGVSPTEWVDLCYWADRLPNIQLLRSEDNRGGGKVATMPKPWLESLVPATRKRYATQHVKNVPESAGDAMPFWDRREEALAEEIGILLGT